MKEKPDVHREQRIESRSFYRGDNIRKWQKGWVRLKKKIKALFLPSLRVAFFIDTFYFLTLQITLNFAKNFEVNGKQWLRGCHGNLLTVSTLKQHL